MSYYEKCQLLELEEEDGTVTEYLSMHEVMVPEFKNIRTFKYIWKDGDRLDRVAKVLLGSSTYKEYIMLLNPKYMDESEIVPEDIIKIPVIQDEDTEE